MKKSDRISLITSIFRAEAEKGNTELTGLDIRRHALNQKSPGRLTRIFNADGPLGFLHRKMHSTTVYSDLVELEEKGIISERQGDDGRYYHRLTLAAE